ncbi:hypothetical protein A3K72_03500 [Candidatus Woesearchaeota archaeon RBG_13_36_6]|nr:MAG: hypothetical protein A3K72_03500 [Candidatus Woesearchaeota archaeon RBG_13_36_6]
MTTLEKALMKIKGMILDVDGVIIGEKIGFNSPYPHNKVVKALKDIRAKGIFISLCTAKPYFAIEKIIRDADLKNFHITDGGGVIIDIIDNSLLKASYIEPEIAGKVLSAYLRSGVYVEFYTVDKYFIQKSQESSITPKHAHVLQREPVKVNSLIEAAAENKITKIMPIAINEEDKKNVTKIFEPFKEDLILSWGIHPIILPLQFGIITAKGISKKSAAQDIIKHSKVSFQNILGVGDTGSDWQFISLCKYAAAMGNAKEELKELVLTKGEKHSFIGPSVDENGILDIFKHFGLIEKGLNP